MAMTDTDLRALLGEFYDDTTDERRAAIRTAAATIEARYPDDEDSARDALTAAMQVILGDATLEEAVAGWHRARAAERAAHAAMTGALIAAGGPETTLARRAGLTRMTVRKALGK